MSRTSRRSFLQSTASFSLAASFHSFLGRVATAGLGYRVSGYGPLRPTPDETTGIPLLNLPEGFSYRSFSWTGDVMSDGNLTPPDHDGMGVIADHDGILTIVRNHEITTSSVPFGTAAIQYDAKAGGGCAALKFNSKTGEWLEVKPVLAGTVKNCAGGPTPWGTWLSCEESVFGPGSKDDGKILDFESEHGWVFEVDPSNPGTPVPLKDMGRFVHEAVAIDPATGYVYETEDRGLAGFYRFLPNTPGKLVEGGKLQMLKVAGATDLRTGLKVGQAFDVSWVDIEDVQRAHSKESKPTEEEDGDCHGVYSQGKALGAATFARLEGCWFGNERVYLDSTSGGDKGTGQIWEYNPREERLTLIFESPSAEVLDSPDNLTVSPRGGIVLCEDGDVLPHRIHGLTAEGSLFTFAENNVVLNGERNGFKGDFRAQEWAGATFSPDGKWLFVNVQTPGMTLAITGPWGQGLI
ncbi:MAG: alkaline phosphatase PhoX [Fuerstiella sp.]